MKIVHGDCGHIKAWWDNHHNCLKCSSCSRLPTCSMCSTWSEETWVLADKRCTYTARKPVMTRKRQNKKKRLAVTSDLSDDNTVDGNTTPQGYTVRGRTHQGGCYADAECIRSESPLVTDQPVISQAGTGEFFTGQPGTGQPVTSHSVITRHQPPGS